MAEPRKPVKPLTYDGRAERYLRQRGIAWDPARISLHRMTPGQRRRALKKELRALAMAKRQRKTDT